MMTFRGAFAAGLVGLASAFPVVANAQSEEAIAAAKEDGKLVLYSDLPAEVVEALTNAFSAKYDGIAVEFFRGDTSQVMQRFETESAAGTHLADVVTTTDRQSKILRSKGFTAPHTAANIDAYPENLRAPDDAWNNYGLVTLGIAWNTEEVAEDEVPTSWDELIEPQWKGRLGIQDPLQGGGAGIWVVTMYDILGEDAWETYMTALGQQDMRYGRYFEVREMLASGEIDLQLIAYPSFTQPIINDGAPIAWTHLDPSLYTGQSLNLSANAPNSDAGKLFIDFVMSDDGQTIMADMNQVPALSDKLPEVFAPIAEANLLPQAHELEQERFDLFQERMKAFFTR